MNPPIDRTARRAFAVALAAVALGTGAACRTAGADESPVSIESIKDRWLKTLRPERFHDAVQVKFRCDMTYPDGLPAHYSEWSENRIFGAGPKRRLEVISGPFLPDNSEESVFITLYNGNSSVEQYNGIASVSRSHRGNDIHGLNLILAYLGIPHTEEQFGESKRGQYWIPEVVRSDNGYVLEANTEEACGVPCRVIRKGDQDRLWFDCRGPVRLMKRDVWSSRPKLNHEVIEFDAYREDEIPERIVNTISKPAKNVGEKTTIQAKVALKVLKLSFKAPPDEVFTLHVKPGFEIVDDRTQARYMVQAKGQEPLADALEGVPQYSSGRFSWMFWLNALFGSIIAIIVAVNVRGKTVGHEARD